MGYVPTGTHLHCLLIVPHTLQSRRLRNGLIKMPKVNKITALTKDEASSMFENGTCITARYQDINHIYIPKWYYDIIVRCCCGVESLGPTAARKHQWNCYRYLKYKTGDDYLQTPGESDYLEEYTPVRSPLTLIEYQQLEKAVISERNKGRICLHHHHNDVYVCACGEKSINYWGIVHHHKECDDGPLEDEYKTMDQIVKTVEHVNSESQQIKADKEKIAEEKREKKKIARNKKAAKIAEKKIKKRRVKEAKTLKTRKKNIFEQNNRAAERTSRKDAAPTANDESTASKKKKKARPKKQKTAQNKKSVPKKKTSTKNKVALGRRTSKRKTVS